MPVLDTAALIEDRLNRIRQYHHSAQVMRAELDVSGGLDSAVMLGLLVRALGADQVTAVYQGIHSSPESLERAREVAQTFGVDLVEADFSDEYETIVENMITALVAAGYDEDEIRDRCDADPTILGSIRSCLRAPLGRGFNRLTGGGIRHGTGNECEDRWLRFYQKGGDGEVDTNPIAMLSKGEVYQLGVALGVPKSILSAMPSPDLWGTGEGHNDEDELKSWLGVPFTYSRVDPETGEYTYVGTIERVSRWLDSNEYGEDLFIDGKDSARYIHGQEEHPAFADFREPELVVPLLKAAERAERITRHKMNPNCPMLGSREELLSRGILTNDLPDLNLERNNQ